MPLVMAISAPISGALSDRIGARIPATLGMLAMTAGLFWLKSAGDQLRFALSLAVCGLGTGTFISPNTSSVMGSAPRNRQGIASGVVGTARTTGMVVGVALSGAVYAAMTRGGMAPEQAYPMALWPAIVASAIAAIASLLGQAKPMPQAAE
jgi:MFS family permease